MARTRAYQKHERLLGSHVGALMTRIQQLSVAAALHRQGRLAEAAEAYSALLRANPNDPDALHLLGVVAYQRGDFLGAIELIRRALKRGGTGPHFHVNLGAAYRSAGQLGKASEQYRAAIRLDPRSADAHNNLGNVLQLTGDTDAALEHLRKALELTPGDDVVHSNLLYTLNFVSELAPSEIAKAHSEWGASRKFPSASPCETDRTPGRRLRVGYVSADLRTHSVTFFLAPLMAAHDRKAFEIFCYSAGVRTDDTTTRLKALSDGWTDIAGYSDDEAAAQIRKDRIDILVDLAGHTSGNRLGIFARRAAPVQVTWLGYPNSTGLDTMDYRVTDAYVDPEGVAEPLHTEKLLRLAGGFLCYEPWATAPDVSPLPAARTPHIAFGSFNNLAKVGPRTLDLWANVLRAVDDSVLVIKATPFADPGVRTLFEVRFKARGIPHRRLRLLPEEPSVNQHLARYGEIDIALDPFPYSGTTTTCEALYMGIPVVTLEGDRHASRVSADLLSRIGFQHLVAKDESEYVAIAARLAGDREALARTRATLRQGVLTSPLCDAPRFAREMESAFVDAWNTWCTGNAEAAGRSRGDE